MSLVYQCPKRSSSEAVTLNCLEIKYLIKHVSKFAYLTHGRRGITLFSEFGKVPTNLLSSLTYIHI